MGDIEANVQAVRRRIAAAAERAGRAAADVRLLAVSKTVEPTRIEAAIAAGVHRLGESRVQEAEHKIPLVVAGAEWHFIGPLQSNKARLAAALFGAVHSVDRRDLVERLAAAAGQRPEPLGVYVQIDATSGPDDDLAAQLCRAVSDSPSLRLLGLMTMAPYDPDPEAARPTFRRLRRLRDRLQAAEDTLPALGLSMGMSGDFEVAIEEGSTLVRVGTAIFGDRSTTHR